MKHKNKVRKLINRQMQYDNGPREGKDRYRWDTLKRTNGVHRPGSVNK